MEFLLIQMQKDSFWTKIVFLIFNCHLLYTEVTFRLFLLFQHFLPFMIILDLWKFKCFIKLKIRFLINLSFIIGIKFACLISIILSSCIMAFYYENHTYIELHILPFAVLKVVTEQFCPEFHCLVMRNVFAILP